MRPSTVRPSALARSALISTSAAAPSLIDEALAAVTVPSFLKTGLRRRDLLRLGVLRALVLARPRSCSPFLPGTVHRDDLRLEQALLLGLDGAAGGLDARTRPGPRGGCPGCGALLGADAHVDVVVDVPQAVEDHRVLELDVAHASAAAHGVADVGRVGHGLHAARHHHVGVTERDGLRAGDDGLEARAADLVEGGGGDGVGDARRRWRPGAPAPGPRLPGARSP